MLCLWSTQTGSDAPADDFLARNGLRYGKLYGFAVDMSEDGPSEGLTRDAFHKPRSNGAKVDGKFVPINWQWDGEVKNFRHDGAFDFQLKVPGYEDTDYMWWNANGYDDDGSKTEHMSPDTRPGMTAFVQSSTAGYFGHYYIHEITDALNGADDFPSELDSSYYVYQGESDVSGHINLNGAGAYNIVPECSELGGTDATTNCDSDYSVKRTFEDIDGFEIVSAAEGLYAVIQEDSGNDLGERMFITSTLEHEDDGKEIEYNFMAMSGGQYNTRMSGLVGVPATTNEGGGAHEFSGVLDLSGMLAKGDCEDDETAEFEIKEGQVRDCDWLSQRGKRQDKYCEVKGYNGGMSKIKFACKASCEKFLPRCDGDFVINAHDGAAKRLAEHEVPINDKLIAVNIQAHNLDAGIVKAFKADRGGQVMIYQPDI